MKIVDVQTKKIIDENNWPAPKYWYTTKDGWEQLKKEYAKYQEEWDKIEKRFMYDEKF